MSHMTATASYDYTATQPEELSIKKDDKLLILDDSKTWWLVENAKREQGYVPSNYVKRNKKVDPAKWFAKDRKQKANGPFEQSEYAVPADIRASGLEKVISRYKYQARNDDELTLKKGDKITVMEKKEDGWWYGNTGKQKGWFPSNYVYLPENEGKPQSVEPAVEKPAIHNVRTLYNFTPTNPEELSFKKGEILEIIGKPEEDPEWWEARKTDGSSATGLVPKNYIDLIQNGFQPTKPESPQSSQIHHANAVFGKVILPHHRTLPFVSEPWFWGKLSRNCAEKMLTKWATDGDFLVRSSETQEGDYSISMKAPEKIKHFRVVCQGLDGSGTFTIGSRSFDTMGELLEHYKRSAIFTDPQGNQKMYLVKPFEERQVPAEQ